MQIPFIGRQRELKLLAQILQKRVASLIVLKGRRRIGKSRLAEEFGKGMRTLLFTGLPPSKKVTAQSQRDQFALQMARTLDIPKPRADDWSELFWSLAQHTRRGRVLIVLDEITWLGAKDSTFLGKLKTVWDTDFKKNPKLILMLTGSISSWIEKNILSSTGFFGRISLDMTLEELPLFRCNEFWGKARDRIASYEKFKLLAVTGGVPRYLEELIPEISSEENIKRLCFHKEGLLFQEFERIFSDLFQKKSVLYRKIVERLAEGPACAQDMYRVLDVKKGGSVTKCLQDLELSGFVARDFTWNLKSGRESKLSTYRLRDNYLRFYLRYIFPNRKRIELGRYPFSPAQWLTIFGLQFENLVLNNRDHLFPLLHINPAEVVCDNPFFQRPNQRQRGCQIDYLIQTRDCSLYLCEIKFSKDPVAPQVIRDVEEKIRRLCRPKHFSVRPVLIHVNGVADEVAYAEFFSYVIDFSQLLWTETEKKN